VSPLKANPSVIESHQGWLSVLELSAQEVFELMLGSHLVVATEAASQDQDQDKDGLDITAMVGLAGRLCGVLTIRCSSKSGARMASKMLGVDAEKAATEIWDALGEVCNMIAGNFKNKISGLGDGCMLSVPTVITGGDYCCHSSGTAETLQINLLFEGDRIIAALEIHS
jgi:chemotaxis protein CheX